MKKIPYYILIALLLIPLTSKAQDTYTLLEPLPCVEGTGNNCASGSTIKEINLETYIGYIFKFAIAISAFLAVIMIIWGGFEIMLSEAVSAKLEGKTRIQNALVGLLMVLSSYLILRTIDPRLVEVYTTLPPVDRAAPPPDLAAMYEQLNTDMNNIINFQGQNLKQISDKRAQLQTQLTTVNSQLSDPTISEEEKVTLRTVQESLNEQVKELDLQRNIGLAQNTGLNQYKIALAAIESSAPAENLEAFTASGANVRQNIIFEQYQPKILDAERRNSTEEKQMLGNQRNFFMNQVREEVLIKQYVDNKSKEAISGKINEYNSELSNPTKISGTGIDGETYKKMLELRISKLNEALNKK